jgi:UDP-N-acetyl-2-amino-2-deoxyglucuronate dehydrogenase
MINFGIIGCGVISTSHAKAIKAAKGAKLLAVCDIIEEKAQKLAEEYEVPHYFKDYNKMLELEDLDVVCICTPSGMHSDHTVLAARAGKHVLCEKPLDITKEKMDIMIEECRKHNVKLGGVFQRRTGRNAQEIKAALERGELGKLVLGDAYLKYYRSQEYYDSAGWRGTWELDGGGALMNQGVHGIDLLQWFMGGAKKVFAKAGTLARKIEVEDTAVILLEFENGAFGVIEGTTSVYPAQSTRVEIHGELGTIILEETEVKKWELIGGKDRAADFAAEEHAGGASDPTAISSTGHQFLVEDMMEAIKLDRDPFIPGEEARKSVDLILAIYESSRTGKEIEL